MVWVCSNRSMLSRDRLDVVMPAKPQIDRTIDVEADFTPDGGCLGPMRVLLAPSSSNQRLRLVSAVESVCVASQGRASSAS
jgi:hypothetical protein